MHGTIPPLPQYTFMVWYSVQLYLYNTLWLCHLQVEQRQMDPEPSIFPLSFLYSLLRFPLCFFCFILLSLFPLPSVSLPHCGHAVLQEPLEHPQHAEPDLSSQMIPMSWHITMLE